MFQTVPAHPALAGMVHQYWFVEDRAGVYEGRAIRTSPVPGAVLSVNLGRPNMADDGMLVPNVSILGVQTRARGWRSFEGTVFVMAMLTLDGLARLFPHAGPASGDRLVEIGAIEGDRAANGLADDVSAAEGTQKMANALDRWLVARLARPSAKEAAALARACAVLRRGGSVARAARAVDCDRRQLYRWFHRHLGVGPKDVFDLERLQGSVRAVQTAEGDGVAGYSDQAHQIRCWRRRLGVTPGAYGRGGGSSMAAHFAAQPASVGPSFYL